MVSHPPRVGAIRAIASRTAENRPPRPESFDVRDPQRIDATKSPARYAFGRSAKPHAVLADNPWRSQRNMQTFRPECGGRLTLRISLRKRPARKPRPRW